LQAVSSVSDLISRGRFDELEGLVTDDVRMLSFQHFCHKMSAHAVADLRT